MGNKEQLEPKKLVCSRKKSQAKSYELLALLLEFTTNTELKTKSATHEVMSSVSKEGTSMLI